MIQMLQKFSTSKKWKSIINWKETEVRLTVLITIIFSVFLYFGNFYDCFAIYLSAICNMFGIIIGGFIATLAFCVAGIAFISGLFDEKQLKLIERNGQSEKVENIMLSYVFSAFLLGFNIMLLILEYILMNSPFPKLPVVLFWIIVLINIYLIVFNVFYLIALSYNALELYKIKNKYQKIFMLEKSFYESVNEIKIDFLIKALMEVCGESLESMYNKMRNFIISSDIERKNEILEYLDQYYRNEK